MAEAELADERPAPTERAVPGAWHVALLNEYIKRETTHAGRSFDDVAQALMQLLLDGEESTVRRLLRARRS
ncbi:hypothetical protein OG512_04535 [Streptomyces sp. NBC_01378]|uniref:hypothetical protein n=1 Tax=Streptomyces sp. NBC_01378 TaxID=2903844 RepID=UPI003245C21C